MTRLDCVREMLGTPAASGAAAAAAPPRIGRMAWAILAAFVLLGVLLSLSPWVVVQRLGQ